MPLKMNAAVVEQFGKPLVLREWDIPSPGAGQILVKTEACGVCHTDLHAAHGDWPVKPTLPFIPGHEAIGLVAAVGSGVTIVKEGDRVGVPWLYSACGHCEYCLTAWETVCAQAQFGGYTRNGGFAEYILADPNYVAHVPAGLAPADAAPLICAGITTYKGIKETEAKPGEWIAISGVGGLGHLAIQYAKAMGLHVCAIDIDDGKLAHAKRLGADLVINAKAGDPAAALKKADRRRRSWRSDYGALAERIQAGRWHDPQAWHLRPGRAAARRIPGSAVRCGGELHHHPRFVRRHAPGYGRSARLRRRGQGQGRYRAAAAVFDQPNLRPARAWRCGVTSGPGLHAGLKREPKARQDLYLSSLQDPSSPDGTNLEGSKNGYREKFRRRCEDLRRFKGLRAKRIQGKCRQAQWIEAQ